MPQHVSSDAPLARRPVLRAGQPAPPTDAPADPLPPKVWSVAFARAARDLIGLRTHVIRREMDQLSLAEIIELAPEQGLFVMLEDDQGTIGVLTLPFDLVVAMIERQTIGQIHPDPAMPRRLTRTDIALCLPVIDHALMLVDRSIAQQPGMGWPAGFRPASSLVERHPLALLLEDEAHMCLRLELSLEDSLRDAEILLLLPETAMPQAPDAAPLPATATHDAQQWSAVLADSVLQAEVPLRALLGRISLPLRALGDLQVGQVLHLPGLDARQVRLVDCRGHAHAHAQLGQIRGMKALRLQPPDAAPPPPPLDAFPPAPPSAPARPSTAVLAAHMPRHPPQGHPPSDPQVENDPEGPSK